MNAAARTIDRAVGSSARPETIGVLIPTYRRSLDLLRCLDALRGQDRPPDEVIVTVRREDTETQNVLAGFDRSALPLRILLVEVPGTVYAHNVAIEACTTDVLAMIDDDTAPQAHWLKVILEDFQADPLLGGLGGRDRCLDGTSFDEGKADTVGKLQWWGRAVGNHHRGFGSIRAVDLLKGANMSFRTAALEKARCDTRLRGRGAQPNEDTSLTLAVKRAGWKIAYDPNAVVDHYQAQREEARHYGGIAPIKDPEPFVDFAYNEVIGIWDFLPITRRIVFVLWSLLIGTGVCPGLLQAVRFTPRLGAQSWYRFFLAQRGKWVAIADLIGVRTPRGLMTGAEQSPSPRS
jgi:cellulose synthase/poly-beta-1,6-N-acetylglucosamine synthase-like glycosyltransferase